MASIVNLPLRKPNWFSEELFSPTMWLCSRCRIISSKSFHIVSDRHICLSDVASSRGFSPFLRRTKLCLFHSSKNFPSRGQELKASWRISGYTATTSLRISLGIPSIPGAVWALNLPPALLSSSRVKRSSHRTIQDLRSCLYVWIQASHDVLYLIEIVQARCLSSSHQSLSQSLVQPLQQIWLKSLLAIA